MHYNYILLKKIQLVLYMLIYRASDKSTIKRSDVQSNISGELMVVKIKKKCNHIISFKHLMERRKFIPDLYHYSSYSIANWRAITMSNH